jgi:hypothetical protein
VLKDIEIPTQLHIGVAIVKELNNQLEEVWNCYFINFSAHNISNVMITCKGYGELNGRHCETSVTRYFMGDIAQQDFKKIEPIDPALFELNNEYFVTYYHNQQLIEKKIVFTANTIFEDLFIEIELIKKKGILIS